LLLFIAWFLKFSLKEIPQKTKVWQDFSLATFKADWQKKVWPVYCTANNEQHKSSKLAN